MALETVGAKLTLRDRVKFGRDARGAAKDVRELGDAAEDAGRELSQAERRASRAGAVFGKAVGGGARKGLDGLKRFASFAARTGPLAVAAIGAGAGVAGRQLLQLGTQLEATGNKARTVFGDQLGSFTGWAAKSAEKMGLTTNELVGMGAGFADLLVPMGFTRKQAAGLTQQTLGLSGALSQWSGGTKSAAEVSDILAGAMLGETDALKSLGIGLSAAEVDARLLAKGQSKLTGQALEQAKAQATLDLILGKSTDAQKAYAAGTNKLGLAQAKLSAKWKTLREQAAQRFAPHALTILEKLSAALPRVQRAVGSFVRGALPPIREGFRSFGESMRSVSEKLGGITSTGGKSKALGATIGTLIGKLVGFAGKAAEVWVSVSLALARFAADVARTVGDVLGFFARMFRALGKLPGDAGKMFRGAADDLRTASAGAEAFAITLDKLAKPRTATFTTVYKSATAAGAAPGIARFEAQEARDRRATGGRLRLGVPTIVGERGPETIVPQQHGYVLTARRTAALTLGDGPKVDEESLGGGVDLATALHELAQQPIVVQINRRTIFEAVRTEARNRAASM